MRPRSWISIAHTWNSFYFSSFSLDMGSYMILHLPLSLSLSLSLIRYGGVFILEFIFLVWGSPFTNERDLSVCLVHWIRIATWIIIFITGNKICRNWKTKHTHTLGYIYIYNFITIMCIWKVCIFINILILKIITPTKE